MATKNYYKPSKMNVLTSSNAQVLTPSDTAAISQSQGMGNQGPNVFARGNQQSLPSTPFGRSFPSELPK